MKRRFFVILIPFLFIVFVGSLVLLENEKSFAQDWKTLADNLVGDCQGKIISIEQLNSSTCWAVLSPMISNYQAVELAESIGYYIRNSTGGIRGQKPSVHVFVSGKHIAIARPYGMKYKGKLDIANWDPSAFGGKYRP